MPKLFKKIPIKLSKIKPIRSLAPFMNIIYEAHVKGDKNAQIILANAKVGRKRSIYFWRWAPRKYWGGGMLNLLGLSLIRYFYHNSKYLLRFIRKDFQYQDLKNFGIQLSPNLFSKTLIDEILRFYHNYQKDTAHHFEDFSELLLCNTKKFDKKGQDYVDIINKILNEAQIIKLGEEITGKKIAINPFISILHYRSSPQSKVQLDGQNIPHFDVFYPSYKLFVYLNEVTTDNGAFNYLMGSQEFSFRNAINYYKDTFRYYFKGGSKAIYPTDATASLYQNDYKWFAACGHPGDGIIFNVQGIHKRGEFKKDIYRERLVLLVDFRQVEVPIQKLAANA